MKNMKRKLVIITVMVVLFCTGCGADKNDVAQYNMDSDDTFAAANNNSGMSESDYVPVNNAASINGADYRYVTCYRCNGNGICTHCDGDCFRNGRRCHSCKGNGFCTVCEGNGALPVVGIDGKDYTYCTVCHGDGLCQVCEGSGIREDYFSSFGKVTSECMGCNGRGVCLGCKGDGIIELKGF